MRMCGCSHSRELWGSGSGANTSSTADASCAAVGQGGGRWLGFDERMGVREQQQLMVGQTTTRPSSSADASCNL